MVKWLLKHLIAFLTRYTSFMTVDNSKLNYYSGWDIDQLVASDSIVVSPGTTALYTIPSSLPTLPSFEVQLKPTGSSKWFQAGSYTTSDTYATHNSFVAYIQSGVIYIVCAGGTARYFVWSDKVDY